MDKQFVPIDIALELKQLGFQDECLGFYYYDGSFKSYRLVYDESSSDYLDVVPAPLWQQVVDWFIEKHNIALTLTPDRTTAGYFNLQVIGKFDPYKSERPILWTTDVIYGHENGLETLIREALNLLRIKEANDRYPGIDPLPTAMRETFIERQDKFGS